MINKCYQYESFYTSSMLGILQENEQLSGHTLHQRSQFWVQKLKKCFRRSESGAFFQILMHNNFWQTNVKCYSIRFFYTSSMLGILQQNKEWSSYTHHQRQKLKKKN